MTKDTQNTQNGALYNALTTGSRIVGNIFADDNFRLDGILDGNLECRGKIIIGSQGSIKGDIKCISAEIYGQIVGNLFVTEQLTLHQTANVQGTVHTGTLSIEANAIFNGTCAMGNAPEPEAANTEND